MEIKTRNFNNPYYPYEKCNIGFTTLKGAELIPYRLLTYLLDLPDKYGYVPVDDNSRPRVRLIKYIYYDEPNPLAQPLPTPEQKLSLLYSGEKPAITTEEDKEKHPKGYRILPQTYTKPTTISAKVLLKCYMAREIPRSDYKIVLGVNFSTIINYALDNIMGTPVYSRGYAIHQCLVEALHGIDIAGVGTVHYSKPIHGDSGRPNPYHSEGDECYDDTFFAIDWQESQLPVNLVQDW